jgi:hypothetical protein
VSAFDLAELGKYMAADASEAAKLQISGTLTFVGRARWRAHRRRATRRDVSVGHRRVSAAHYGKDFQCEAFRKLDGKTPNENARGMLRNRRDAALTADGEYGSCAAAPTCVENSPERRGELGCSIIENKLLPNGLKGPLFWHIDRFDSAERARTAVGPGSVAFEAAGTSWLMTIESQTSNHHGGRHVAQAIVSRNLLLLLLATAQTDKRSWVLRANLQAGWTACNSGQFGASRLPSHVIRTRAGSYAWLQAGYAT